MARRRTAGRTRRRRPRRATRYETPVVIVEVLSRTTRPRDVGGKWRAYRQLETLRHYILVEPEIIRASFAPLRAEPEEMGEHRLEFAAKMLDRLTERIKSGEVKSDEPVAIFVELL